MQDFEAKVDNTPGSSSGRLSADEFNNLVNEIEGVITSSGQTLAGATTFQLAKAVSIYAAAGNYYLDSGSANTYSLTPPGSRKAPHAYVDGQTASFIPGNTNSGASTVNIAAIGVKDIRRPNGDPLSSGDLQAGAECTIRYKASSDYFILSQYVTVTGNQNIFNTKTFVNVPKSSEDPAVAADLVRLSYMQSYVAANASVTPPGVIEPYGGTSAPTGYLLCYGQAVSRATYAALFAIIASTYGSGDGSTTFNLPDLRGRIPAGKDNMGGSAANRLVANGTTLGAVGGAETHTLITGEIPSHVHTMSSLRVDFPGNAPGGSANSWTAQGGYSHDTDATGGGSAHNNMPPYLITNYIIKT